MKMVLLTAVVILAVILVAFVLLALWRRSALKGLYDRHPLMLTAAERSFYGALMAAVDVQYFVAPKVRVADVLRPKVRLSKKIAALARHQISRKHFDFVLCNPDTFAIVAAVELVDESHEQGKRRARDSFLDASAKGAELPLFRVKVQASYSVPAIREALGALVDGARIAAASDASPTASLHVRKGPPKSGPTPPRARRVPAPPATGAAAVKPASPKPTAAPPPRKPAPPPRTERS